jgi:mRNA-degrading endonuclease YafQ of YafQ-DinJ toxin-antitoxin module
MIISPLRAELKKKLRSHKLEGKWKKSVELFQANMKHPSLNVELLEPHWRGVYSFRIDKTYPRTLFCNEQQSGSLCGHESL